MPHLQGKPGGMQNSFVAPAMTQGGDAGNFMAQQADSKCIILLLSIWLVMGVDCQVYFLCAQIFSRNGSEENFEDVSAQISVTRKSMRRFHETIRLPTNLINRGQPTQGVVLLTNITGKDITIVWIHFWIYKFNIIQFE